MTSELEVFRYYKGDQIKQDEMGGACSMHGKDEKCIKDSCRKAWRRRRRL